MSTKEYYQANKEKYAARWIKYYEKNKEKLKAKGRRYQILEKAVKYLNKYEREAENAI